MPKTYKIRDGFSFVMPDQSVKVGGDTIDLDDDIAANHAHKLELVEGKKKSIPVKKPDTPPADTGSADSAEILDKTGVDASTGSLDNDPAATA